MFTSELRARIMAFTDNLDPQDGEWKPRTRRIVQDIQQVFDEVWNDQLWRWSLGSAVLTVPTGERIATLPADFGHIHKEGGIFIDEKRLRDVSSSLMDEIVQGTYVASSQVGYSITGFSDADQRGTVMFDSLGPLSPVIKYKKRAPLLADKPWQNYPVLSVVASGALTGTVYYKAAYETADGFLQEPGDPISIVLVAQNVSALLPDPGPVGEHSVKYVNLFRTVIGGGASGTYYRVARVEVTGTNSFTVVDSTLDAALVLLPQLVVQSTLTRIPATYHFTVLLPGVRRMRQQGKGDTRDFEKEYRIGLAKMIVRERPFQSEIQQLPRWSPYMRD